MYLIAKRLTADLEALGKELKWEKRCHVLVTVVFCSIRKACNLCWHEGLTKGSKGRLD